MPEEMQRSSTVRLELESRPESVALVRAMLSGVAERFEFDRELADDLNTTVSEACNNVIQHAYADGGPMIVRLDASEECVEVSVCDRGFGLEETTTPPDDQVGIGLALIRALADRAQVLGRRGGGTEVRLAFSRNGSPAEDETWSCDGAEESVAAPAMSGDVTGTLAPVNLLSTVLGRMARLLAARARFSLDRVSDLYLLFDQLAFHAARGASSPELSFAMSAETRRLELDLGPIREAPGTAAPAEAHLNLLADEVTVRPIDDSVMLHVVVGPPPTISPTH